MQAGVLIGEQGGGLIDLLFFIKQGKCWGSRCIHNGGVACSYSRKAFIEHMDILGLEIKIIDIYCFLRCYFRYYSQ